MRTVSVIALKGGSGKTTVATHLALAAHLRGVDALLVDADPQRSAANILSARSGAGPTFVAAAGAKLASAKFAALGLGKQLLVVDTPAGAVENVTDAIALADLAVMVVRPTLLDLAGLAPTLGIVRRLGRPATVVLNQAPVARENAESPLVKRVLRGLDYMQAPVAPIVVRLRTVYQTALETGRSAEEMSDHAAAREIAALWDFIDSEAASAAAAPPQAAAGGKKA